MKAIVIEDTEMMRELIVDIMGELNFEVIEAEHGKAGFEALQANPDTAVIMVDWMTPEMSGIEFVKLVRQNPQYDAIKLIMVTGLTEVNEVMVALEAGANEYIMKPCTKEMFEDKLRLVGFDLGLEHSSAGTF